MIRCQSCGAIHAPNTLFCDECGYRLLNARSIDANPLPAEAEPEAVTPIRLFLLTPDDVKQFECQLTSELLVGRADFTANVRPDVDLYPLQGISQGVSRRHARLLRSGQKVLVEDLDSVNGTFLRGIRLAAHHPQDIQPGDEIRFGRVVLKVVFDDRG